MISELAQMPPVPEELALAAFALRLRADPALGRAVKTWVTWDGDAADAEPPSSDMTPWVRVTPSGGPCARVFDNPTDGATEVPILVDVECAVADLSAAARFRFWDLVRTALLPTGDAKLAGIAAFAAAGINDFSMTRSGYGIDSATTDGLIVSKGQFQLLLTIET